MTEPIDTLPARVHQLLSELDTMRPLGRDHPVRLAWIRRKQSLLREIEQTGRHLPATTPWHLSAGAAGYDRTASGE